MDASAGFCPAGINPEESGGAASELVIGSHAQQAANAIVTTTPPIREGIIALVAREHTRQAIRDYDLAL